MAGGFTAYLDNKVIDHVFGAGTYPKPTLYLALTVAGVEVATGASNYVRQPIGVMNIATNTATLNANVDFAVAGTNWGTIDGAEIWDAVSAGNKVGIGTLTTPKLINAGDIFRAPASSITVTVT